MSSIISQLSMIYVLSTMLVLVRFFGSQSSLPAKQIRVYPGPVNGFHKVNVCYFVPLGSIPVLTALLDTVLLYPFPFFCRKECVRSTLAMSLVRDFSVF